jgi:hypothetical protein
MTPALRNSTSGLNPSFKKPSTAGLIELKSAMSAMKGFRFP